MRVRETKFPAQRREYLPGEEGNLAFVIFLVTKEAVAANPLAGYAVNLITFQYWMLAGRSLVVAEEVVAG